MAVPRVEALIKTLEQFATADEVADYLWDEGIKGRPGNPNHCPIARLFNRGRERGRFFYTYGGGTLLRQWNRKHNTPTKVYELPSVASEFAAHFDAGRYPHLEEWRTST